MDESHRSSTAPARTEVLVRRAQAPRETPKEEQRSFSRGACRIRGTRVWSPVCCKNSWSSSGCSYFHFHRADFLDRRQDCISRLYRTHSFGSTRDDDIPGVQGVKGRRELDKLGNAEDHVLRIGVLPHFPIHADAQVEQARVGYLVCSHHPGPKNGIAVRRLAQASLLGSADRNVQADGITGDVFEGLTGRNVVRPFADNDRKFHLMVVAAIQLTQLNTFSGSNQ